jgi:Mn2+/Fe2+ NRAMP family transporter
MADIRSQVQFAVLDSAHLGDIEGALGTIYQHDTKARLTWRNRLATLLAILGPGLIVMAGDNDAGAFATYTQAGQNYGTTLLWTLGAVTGAGHARLILECFGKFWGAFSVSTCSC